MEYIYKIRRNDGLFSGSGRYPTWTKSGKSWAKIGALKNHVGMLSTRDQKTLEVVKYRIIEEEAINMYEFTSNINI